MDRVGGYAGYLALCDNAAALDDVVTAMLGESEARRIDAMRARAR